MIGVKNRSVWYLQQCHHLLLQPANPTPIVSSKRNCQKVQGSTKGDSTFETIRPNLSTSQSKTSDSDCLIWGSVWNLDKAGGKMKFAKYHLEFGWSFLDNLRSIHTLHSLSLLQLHSQICRFALNRNLTSQKWKLRRLRVVKDKQWPLPSLVCCSFIQLYQRVQHAPHEGSVEADERRSKWWFLIHGWTHRNDVCIIV